MLTFFPEPYPDELLYSILARYHLRSSNTSSKDTLRDLFEYDSAIATIDLPSHLNKLCSNLPAGSKLSCSEIIDNHTMYPLYAPFLPKKRARKVKKMMLSERGNAIHMSSGIMASGVISKKNLLFCPKCFDEDILMFGEPYWHRVHQIPGVFVCHIHDVILQKLKLDKWNRHKYISLPLEKPMGNFIIDENKIDNKTRKLLYEFALEVKKFLDLKNVPNLYNSKKTYMNMLHEKGYLTANNRIRQIKLHEQFLLFYGDEFLNLLSSSISNNNSWLADLVRKSKKAQHSIRHLLLIKFLFGSIKEFHDNMNTYHPFGEGPWPCLNKAAHHYLKNVVENCQVTRCSKSVRPVGTFICDCGFIYSRRGPDEKKQDRYKTGRIKQFGAIWIDKLKIKLEDKSVSYRKIAKELGVDTNTVIKYEKKIQEGMNFEAIHAFEKNNLSKDKNKAVKIKQNNDNQNSTRVNWEIRDLKLSYLVEEECKQILLNNENKPLRITLTSIGNRLDCLSLLEKNKHRLPITMEILNKYIESIEQFQIRRVKWAAKELSSKGEVISKWKIEKYAGLHPVYNSLISDEIEKQILIYDSFNRRTDMGSGNQWLH